MFSISRLWVGVLLRLFRSRQSLLIENLALRQQLAVFKRQRRRPRLTGTDKLFWLLLHRFWSSWKTVLIVVSPDTRGALAPCWLSAVLATDLPRA
jgi:hypothetical protein